LDIGTGTGLWAIEFADRWPNASVTGTDLSPIQPDMVPDNVRFEIADVESDWMLKENSLDYVHSRIMIGALTDYQETMVKAYQCVLSPINNMPA
jgi:ubiquinone/menaquinone biosynthesis C-methylase UbiE